MQFKSIPWWLWLVPIALALGATAHLPYGYYTFTRIVICGFGAFFAYVSWQGDSVSKIWAAIFALLAVLFNPIFPIYLHRVTWQPIDIGVAVIFAAHLLLVRLR